MSDIFDIELLNYDPKTPGFYIMLLTALMAFFLSSLIVITYEFTTKSIYRKAHFLQSLALIGIVAATVMQAIGESVAVGLGILGALSIIRFRTQLDDPRNITFMFASLAAGIACGVLGYKIALTGTLVFCLAAIIMRWSHIGQYDELIGELRLQFPNDMDVTIQVEQILRKFCRNVELDQWRMIEPMPRIPEPERENDRPKGNKKYLAKEVYYLIRMKKSLKIEDLESELHKLNELTISRLYFRKDPLRL